MIYGAIIGDIVGSRFENDKNHTYSKNFAFFDPRCRYTDDTVLTVAVANAMIQSISDNLDEKDTKNTIIEFLRKYCRLYPEAGYGSAFKEWVNDNRKTAYNSYGNGSAMRCSSVGWLYDNLDTTLNMAKLTAEVTHNHEEGIKGAQAVASAIYLARNGFDKNDIKDYIESTFNYNLNLTIDEIKLGNMNITKLKTSCMIAVPNAIMCFLQSTDFEDTIRNAIYIGGDTDTVGAIAGSIAEAYYGISDEMKEECQSFIDNKLLTVINDIESFS